jgi:uncharacterized repeat protein (TIGR02543 family)
MKSVKKTFICSLSIVLLYLIVTCENQMTKSILPDVNDTDTDGRIKHENAYTIVYYANGGKGKMQTSAFVVGVWLNLPSNTFTREGYMFTGWAVSADGDVEYADKAAIKDLAASGETVTLYAKWGGIV